MIGSKRLMLVAMAVAMAAAPEAAAFSPDFSDSFRHWKQDAEQGRATAQYFMGQAYLAGRGAYCDYARAWLWFSLAAAQAEPGASDSLVRLEKRMSPAQSRKARQLLREWQAEKR